MRPSGLAAPPAAALRVRGDGRARRAAAGLAGRPAAAACRAVAPAEAQAPRPPLADRARRADPAPGRVDFGAKAFAENAIASKIDSSGLGTKPSVDIEGFPFLTQVASRDLSQIDINASNFTVKQVVISSLHATATGVRPNASFNGATISKINGTVVVSFATVTNLIPIPGLTVSADPADGPDAIKFNSSLGGATGKIEQISPNVIKVDVGNLTGLAGLASLIGGSTIASSYTFAIPKLPAGLVVRSINVTSQGIVATASAQNTTLSQ